MNREELLQEACINELGCGIYDKYFRECWIDGARWADDHPKEGLWAKEKVCRAIKDLLGGYDIINSNFGNSYHENKFIDDLCKIMEE